MDDTFREMYCSLVGNDQDIFRRLKGKIFGMIEEVAGTEMQERALKKRAEYILREVESGHADERFRICEWGREELGFSPQTTRPR